MKKIFNIWNLIGLILIILGLIFDGIIGFIGLWIYPAGYLTAKICTKKLKKDLDSVTIADFFEPNGYYDIFSDICPFMWILLGAAGGWVTIIGIIFIKTVIKIYNKYKDVVI